MNSFLIIVWVQDVIDQSPLRSQLICIQVFELVIRIVC